MQESWTDLTFKQMCAVTTNRSAESEVNMIRMDSGVEGSEVSIKNESLLDYLKTAMAIKS